MMSLNLTYYTWQEMLEVFYSPVLNVQVTYRMFNV